MEFDLNQNGYSGHFDNILEILPDLKKVLLENIQDYIENIKIIYFT
jgi:hypothetical protein